MPDFKPMTRAELLRTYPAKIPVTEQSLAIAKRATANLWRERCQERGIEPTDDRSGSCKFAALIAREIFGGKLAGNDEHVFVVVSGSVIDLNDDQADVLALGSLAHLNFPSTLAHPDYRDALGSCVPRATKWAEVALRELADQKPKPVVQKSLLEEGVSP